MRLVANTVLLTEPDMASNATGVMEKKSEVDRAAEGVRGAIGRLVAIFDENDHKATCAAFATLTSIGAFAVAPLATALPRARSVCARAAIMNCLMELAPVARPAVLRAISRAALSDPDPALGTSARRFTLTLQAAGVMEDIARRKAALPVESVAKETRTAARIDKPSNSKSSIAIPVDLTSH